MPREPTATGSKSQAPAPLPQTFRTGPFAESATACEWALPWGTKTFAVPNQLLGLCPNLARRWKRFRKRTQFVLNPFQVRAMWKGCVELWQRFIQHDGRARGHGRAELFLAGLGSIGFEEILLQSKF